MDYSHYLYLRRQVEGQGEAAAARREDQRQGRLEGGRGCWRMSQCTIVRIVYGA
jgi:hypothetical protein